MEVPTISLKERQRQERERLILQAAEEVLAEQGYESTSMEDIANRVGISRAAIYLHFPSKEDLVFALLLRGIQNYAACLDTVLAGSKTPRQKIRAMIELSHAGMAEHSFQFVHAIRQNQNLLNKFAEKHESMRDVWKPIQQQMTEMLEEGKRSGDFDPEMPTPLMSSLLSMLLRPFTLHSMSERDQMPVPTLVDSLTRYFLKGVAPDRAEDQADRADRAEATTEAGIDN